MTTAQQPVSPWVTGDFHVIGAGMSLPGEMLCDDCDLMSGKRVLDVACGSGNTAMAAARRGCRVSGLDLYDKLIDRAKMRAQAEGFDIDYRVGNAEQLPYEDGEFDAVISTFGVMFAPDQEKAASELLRVCKPGGVIGTSNWTWESFPGQMFALGGKHGPPRPAGFKPPIAWGSVAGAERLFGGRAKSIRFYDRAIRMQFETFEAFFETFRTFFGPMKMLFDGLAQERHAEVRDELRELVYRYNRATDATLSIAMSFVNVVVTT